MNKLVLAIHGIGDQTRNDTVLSAGFRVRDYFRDGTVLSLGGFHRALEPVAGTVQPRPPFLLQQADIGLAEVYWADIPRGVADRGYTLQETKAWARTAVERVRGAGSAALQGVNYAEVQDVLEEMITTIGVLESLCFLAKKAGVLDFSLRKLLDDYIGDVQI
ncbi:MAG TPA: hypothetical protein VHV47_05790, partial [Opitutaceae bacterium]|nr:hypothetical protein [Opitutaceae bacterium]